MELTDEVRGVFDRMLASQEEIEAAQARVGFEPIARDLAEAQVLGMTERQFADYQQQIAAAREQAEADLMAQLQEADARARERWWKDELATIRGEVEAEVEATPIVRAYRVLTGRKEAGGEPDAGAAAGPEAGPRRAGGDIRRRPAGQDGSGIRPQGWHPSRRGGHPAGLQLRRRAGAGTVDSTADPSGRERGGRCAHAGPARRADDRRHPAAARTGCGPRQPEDQLLERELGVLADLARSHAPIDAS